MRELESGVYWGQRKYDAEFSIWVLVNAGDENMAGDLADSTTLQVYGGEGPTGLSPRHFVELIRIPSPDDCRRIHEQMNNPEVRFSKPTYESGAP